MRALQAKGMTLIVSSHILSELDEYCTHILSLRGGRVESHEALHGGIKAPAAGGDVPLALYALELAPPPGASAGSLARQLHQVVPDTPVPPPDDQGLVHLQLWLPTPPRERADLLARLVGAGLPVASRACQQVGAFAWRRGQPQLQRSEEHTSELQSHSELVCRLLL